MQPIRQEEQENEKAYANNLYIKKILPGPRKWHLIPLYLQSRLTIPTKLQNAAFTVPIIYAERNSL